MSNDFESRARKAAESVRDQIGANEPDSDKGAKRAKRSAVRSAIPSTALVVMIVGASLVAISQRDNSPSAPTADEPFVLAGALRPFNACDDELQYFKDQPRLGIKTTDESTGPNLMDCHR